MNTKLFNLNRKLEKIEVKEESLTIKHTLVWTIHDFMWLLDNQTNREIRTKCAEMKPIYTVVGDEEAASDSEYSDVESGEEDTEDVESGGAGAAAEQDEFHAKLELVGRENDLIEIYYMPYDTLSVKANCSVLYLQSGYNNSLLYASIAQEQYRSVDKNKWQFLGVQYKRKLQEERKLHNNNFKVKFEFLIVQKSENAPSTLITVEDNKFVAPTTADVRLIDDLSRLLTSHSFSDVLVKSADGREFPAHRNLLGARSAVLRAHFDHDTAESKTNVLESPFEGAVVKELLAYIYTDRTPEIDRLPRKLLAAADYYQINGLKNLCEPAVERTLRIDNAISTLEFANLYRAVYLKRKTLEFIKDGAAADITNTEGWRSTAAADVIRSVYECVVTDKIE